ncbi:dihydropteroate synthase [Limnohabitans sp. Rim11]|jgi:dihydropteroate synthase|uniref:dihydropteroate synthase n=1 Tax=Limnohabitans sp. Rim11 TaxID=1100719 RepID=UPI000A6D7AB4|nr:dihydropteroate synthase [Limnohabitans sp. Rim11]
MPTTSWQTSRFVIDLSQPKVMGIVNITPDSFSDGGQFESNSQALQHAENLLQQGADILDIGGESSRPGSQPLSLEEELSRVLPFVREAVKWQVPLSIDTYKPQVMKAALDLGADIINDIWAMRQAGAWDLMAQFPDCGICLMHMHRDPLTMQTAPMTSNVVQVVKDFLAQQLSTAFHLGVQKERIVIDPGVGFGKTPDQNLAMLMHQSEFMSLGQPLLAGWSRKSTLGKMVAPKGQEPVPSDRLGASLSAALLAVQKGAAIVRVHDVKETVQALKIWQAVQANLSAE